MKRLLLLACASFPALSFGLSTSGINWCCGSFEGGAELLFLRPSLCDLNYAIEDARSADELVAAFEADGALLPQGYQRAIDCHYKWGFRAFLGYVNDCTCFDVRAQYTWLHDHERDVPKDPGLERSFWPTFGQPEFLSAPLANGVDENALARLESCARHNYDAVDLEAGLRRMVGCTLWARAFLGLHYVHIDHNFSALYVGTVPAGIPPVEQEEPINIDITVRDHRQVWAVGPKLGIEGILDIACGFGVGGRAQLGILAGNTHGTFSEVGNYQVVGDDPVAIDLRNRHGDKCVVTPFADMRLGLNYSWCCSCFTFVGEFGYQFISYINSIARQTFNDEAATASTDCQSFNLDGFFLSIRVTL